jgi:hypothetical protein
MVDGQWTTESKFFYIDYGLLTIDCGLLTVPIRILLNKLPQKA